MSIETKNSTKVETETKHATKSQAAKAKAIRKRIIEDAKSAKIAMSRLKESLDHISLLEEWTEEEWLNQVDEHPECMDNWPSLSDDQCRRMNEWNRNAWYEVYMDIWLEVSDIYKQIRSTDREIIDAIGDRYEYIADAVKYSTNN